MLMVAVEVVFGLVVAEAVAFVLAVIHAFRQENIAVRKTAARKERSRDCLASFLY